MKVYRRLEDLPEIKRSLVTIGSFDGVHTGHQRILKRLCQIAQEKACPSVVITFHPHPRAVLSSKSEAPKLLHTLEEKIARIRSFGIDHLMIVPFTKKFAQQEPLEYIDDFLIRYFDPQTLVIGYDHHFGKNRSGNIDTLNSATVDRNFEIVEIPAQLIQDITISSTKIRNAVKLGNIRKANQLLGYPYPLGGEVIHGEKIGAALGFPTANVSITASEKLLPANGIYAAKAMVKTGLYKGMLYIGDRPTIADLNEQSIEINLFDFDERIYGEKIDIEIYQKIRDDARMENLEALKAQLEKDKIAAQHILRDKDTLQKVDPSVTVVILNYNGLDYLKKFLPGVYNSDYNNLEVIISDNGSSDGSLEFLKAEHPEVKVIDLGDNYGFAEGYNRTLKQIESDYFVLLNSDVEVRGDWISPIIKTMERDPSIAVCQPKIRSQKDNTSFEYAGAAGGMIDRYGYPFCRGRIFESLEKDEGQYDHNEEIFWASGAAFFIKGELFHKIGGLDGDYFAHFEEIDLCWRLKRAGYKIWACNDMPVYHVGGGTLDYTKPLKTFLNFRNSLLSIYKNEPAAKLLWLIPFRIIMDAFAGLLFLLKGRLDNIWAIVRAHWSFFFMIRKYRRKKLAYNRQVEACRIGPPNTKTGVYDGFIPLQYYIKGLRTYAQIRKPNAPKDQKMDHTT